MLPQAGQENVESPGRTSTPPPPSASPVRKRKSRNPVCEDHTPSPVPSSTSRKPLRTMPPKRQSVEARDDRKRKRPSRSKPQGVTSALQPPGSQRESTPLSPVTRNSLYGFEDLDSPLAFSPIVTDNPYRPSSQRSSSPQSSRASSVDVQAASSTAPRRELSRLYYQPVPPARTRRRPRPKKKPDQVKFVAKILAF